MKAKPYTLKDGAYHPCDIEEADHVALRMEGCHPDRMIPVIRRGSRSASARRPVWSWNGDTEKPTLKPSILTRGGGDMSEVCHTWVNDGMVQYLEDSTHEFAGQTRPLLDVEE